MPGDNTHGHFVYPYASRLRPVAMRAPPGKMPGTATEIVRRLDDLSRNVIPKEIRRTLRIREGDPLHTTLTSFDLFLRDIMTFTDRVHVRKNNGTAHRAYTERAALYRLIREICDYLYDNLEIDEPYQSSCNRNTSKYATAYKIIRRSYL